MRATDDHRIKRRLAAPERDARFGDLAPQSVSYVHGAGKRTPTQADGAGLDETAVFRAVAADTASDKATEMNETARLAVALMDGTRSMGDIIDTLLDDFDVERERLAADMLQLAAELLSRNVIARVS